ncbi:MAG: DUF6398 domain-containing protein [Planctomycetota bacterium]|jgi:hypothetical protein
MQESLNEIPEEYRQVFQKITTLTDTFCLKHLNEDYQEFCRDMAFLLCQARSPVNRGRPASWAAGIVHAIGWVNFLQDPASQPYMTAPQVAEGFGVSQGTMTAKSKIIRDGLELVPMDPDWCLPEMLKDNPLVWMVEVNGFIMDIRTAPREIQQAAYDEGLIPFIPEPEDEPQPETPPTDGPKILKFPGPKHPKEPPDNGPTLFD